MPECPKVSRYKTPDHWYKGSNTASHEGRRRTPPDTVVEIDHLVVEVVSSKTICWGVMN